MKSDLPGIADWSPYIETAYANGKFSNFGELSHLVEERVGHFLGFPAKNIVTCVNATLALTGAIATSPRSDLPWTIPSWTFTATASSMISANKHFNFSDIDSEWRINPTHTFQNVVDVLPFGEDIDVARIENLCEGELIIDAAASFDALRFSNISTIQRRFALIVSFHPTKFPPGPEGAVFISNDEDWCRNFRNWTIFGMDESRVSHFSGTNAKMNEFSSAVVLASLDNYDSARTDLINSLSMAEKVSKFAQLQPHSALKKGYATPYWIVSAEPRRIKSIELVFERHSISTRRWWMYGCHQMPAYSHIRKADLSQTDSVAKTTLGLPMFRGITTNHWQRIEVALAEVEQ